MKHILSIFCYFLCLFVLTGCPSPYSAANMYYEMEEKARNSGNDTVLPPPPIVDEDEDEEGGGSGEPEVEVPQGSTLITIFEVLQPNGTINKELLAKFPQDVQDQVRASLQNITAFTADSFQSKRISATFDDANVPGMLYTEGVWNSSSNAYLHTIPENRHEYGGSNTEAQGMTVSGVTYYMYDRKNPFYSPTGSFNTATYGDKTDTIMNRFMFYRFTGRAVVVDLDNPLVAVDTYTGLVYVFAKPTAFSGLGAPTRWEAVDVAVTASDGKKYKFYEYDPAGYIDSSGKFVLEAWYIAGQTNENYDPPNTGKSPYLHKVVIADDGSVIEPDEPELFTPIITATTLEADGTLVETEKGEHKGKYYIDINITSPEKEFAVLYELYTREGESGGWSSEAVVTLEVPAKTTEASIPMYRHYDGLILSAFPQYKVIAKDVITGDELGDSTKLVEGEGVTVTVVPAVTGSRMLTEREVFLAAIETIRGSIGDLWHGAGNADASLSQGSRGGSTSGNYYQGIDRHCFTSYNYRHYMRFDNYKNSLVMLNGAFMKNNRGVIAAGNNTRSGIWSHNDTSACDNSQIAHRSSRFPYGKITLYHSWPSNFGGSSSLDKLTVSFEGITIDIVLSSIKIDNTDGNTPEWSSGSFKVTQDGVETEYNKDSGVPFGFFMDAATFRSAIAGDDGYTQE